LEPGWIKTDATAGAVASTSMNEVLMKRIPARRWGEISEFEGIAVYLASDESSYHTGDGIRIDGGYKVF
jgi:NAD(P)-dependent dehydrogenase (short-subunit alcohol dehydrogenase family)